MHFRCLLITHRPLVTEVLEHNLSGVGHALGHYLAYNVTVPCKSLHPVYVVLAKRKVKCFHIVSI